MKYLVPRLLLLLMFPLSASETPQLSFTEAAAAHSFDVSNPSLTFANMCTQAKRSFLPKVNPISGEYVEEEADIVVAGCEPISFRRYYGHMDHGDRRYGLGWRINPEINIVANLLWEGERFAAVGNSNGAMLYMDNQSDIPIPQGFMGGYSLGNNSRYNYTNLDSLDPHNTLLYYRTYHRNDKEFQFLGYTQDGSGKRKEFYTPFFGWHKRQKVKFYPNIHHGHITPPLWIPYQLLVSEEKLPNGNVICY